jgi:hypothetical protein
MHTQRNSIRARVAFASRSVSSLWRSTESDFRSTEYLRHNQRRQEHLASLGLPLAGKTVLETGAGIGDHSTFFLDRGCPMVISDGRPANVAYLKKRFPLQRVELLDLDAPPGFQAPSQIVYCYGTLYHLAKPAEALEYLSKNCQELLLLETCVSFGAQEEMNPVREPRHQVSQAVSGYGCRPTRAWIYSQLKKHFSYVYLPASQPWHEQFPTNWTESAAADGRLTRAVFIASRTPVENPNLSAEIPMVQVRH